MIHLVSLLGLNCIEAKIVCDNEAWNNRVQRHYETWRQRLRFSSSVEDVFQNNPALAYCEYLSQQSQFSADAETRIEANKLLTLIYEAGAYFGLVKASAQEAPIANHHLNVIAQNFFQIDQISTASSPNPSSEVLQIINAEVKDENGQIVQNPNTSILTKYIEEENQIEVNAMTDEIKNNNSYLSLDSTFQNWVRFLAGDTRARIAEYSNIYAVRHLSPNCLEGNHNFIQLLFPNRRMGVIPTYYLDSNNALIHFANLYQNSAKFRNLYNLNLKLSFFCMMKFYGLKTEYSGGSIDSAYQSPSTFTWKLKRMDSSSSKIHKWMNGNHNQLRLTRILIALKMARIDDLADMLYSALQTYGETNNSFWKHAAADENYPAMSPSSLFRKYKYLDETSKSHP